MMNLTAFFLLTSIASTFNIGDIPTISNVHLTQHDCFYQLSKRRSIPIYHLQSSLGNTNKLFEITRCRFCSDGLFRWRREGDVYWFANYNLDTALKFGARRFPCDELDLPNSIDTIKSLIKKYKLTKFNIADNMDVLGSDMLHRLDFDNILEDEFKRNGSYSFDAQGVHGDTKNYYYDLVPDARNENGSFTFQLHVKTPDKKILVYQATGNVGRDEMIDVPIVKSKWNYRPLEILQKADFPGEFFLFKSNLSRIYLSKTGSLYYAAVTDYRHSQALIQLKACDNYKIFHVISLDNGDPFFVGRDRKDPTKYCCFQFQLDRVSEHKIDYNQPHLQKLSQTPLPLSNSQLCLHILEMLKLVSK